MSPAELAAREAPLHCEGRHAVDGLGGLRLGYPGVRVHLRFGGSGIELQAWSASDDACFDVAIDGGAPELLRLHAGEGTYRLAQGLATDRGHSLVLARRTESWQGVCTLRRLALAPGGEWLEPGALPPRRMLFVGDSVTCGEMAGWIAGRRAAFPAADNNALCGYAMVLAKRLEAQCHLVSYGGRGVWRDWQGRRDVVNAPQFYERALPDEATSRWDHGLYVPDVVGVQLGTNDFNRGVPDEGGFAGAYVGLLRKIRSDAPAARIVVMDSPIVTDLPGEPRRTVLLRYLDAIVAAMADPGIVRARLAVYPGVPGNGHPSRAEHEAMADELERLFRRSVSA